MTTKNDDFDPILAEYIKEHAGSGTGKLAKFSPVHGIPKLLGPTRLPMPVIAALSWVLQGYELPEEQIEQITRFADSILNADRHHEER